MRPWCWSASSSRPASWRPRTCTRRRKSASRCSAVPSAFRVGGEERIAGPGERLTVPAGTPHKFWNAGESEAHFVCEVRPALQFEQLLETMFALAADGKTNRKGLPNPRELQAGDEVVVTALDHDANVSPWLQLQEDVGIVVRIADVRDDLSLDLDLVRAQLSDRTRVVAFPAAANSVGTAPDVRALADLAHDAGALAWVDAVHYGPHGPIDVAAWDADVVVCSPYKFFGPHMGLAYGRAELIGAWRPYKVRPAADEPVGRRFELGTSQHELLAGFVAAVDYVASIGWEAIQSHERALGERFLAGLPDTITLYGLPTMAGRVPTFCFDVPGHTSERWRRISAGGTSGRLVGQLLRPRDDAQARARRVVGRRAGRDRALQHGRGGRPAARRAGRARREASGPRRHEVRRSRLVAAATESGHDVTLFTAGRRTPTCSPATSTCTVTATAG